MWLIMHGQIELLMVFNFTSSVLALFCLSIYIFLLLTTVKVGMPPCLLPLNLSVLCYISTLPPWKKNYFI